MPLLDGKHYSYSAKGIASYDKARKKKKKKRRLARYKRIIKHDLP
tara:strand:- start:304 stop:438 length:135 start_codon:yes stop_codon:yes gene_type:complete